jgi:hypothetical protein
MIVSSRVAKGMSRKATCEISSTVDRASPAEYAYDTSDPEFTPPADRNVRVWRYLDLAKPVSLLDKRALFFSRANRLGDDFEGAITRQRQLQRKKFYARRRRAGKSIPLSRDHSDLIATRIDNTIISCWHMNEDESAAMWKLYVAGGQGIAIVSTYKRLAASLPSSHRTEPLRNEDGTDRHLWIKLGVVKYIDFETYEAMANPFLCKRRSFEHERELRAVVEDHSLEGLPRPPRFPAGDYVPVCVAPQSPAWFAESVVSLVKQYGFDFPVRHSDLDKAPIR